ncbi:hypothetical protein [Parapedobacter sp.]
MKTLTFNKSNFFPTLMILLLTYSWGCQKSNRLNANQRCKVVAKIGQDNDIVGKWKMVKGQTAFHEQKIIDFSCDNIIYDFQTDGTLSISSDTENLISLASGKYKYELLFEPLEASNEEFMLRINGLVMGSEISTDAMTINQSYHDGPILHFVRIR